jgi:hypothetical protein
MAGLARMRRRISPTPAAAPLAALAALAVATAGGLLPLARPGAFEVGACALGLVPAAALVFAGPARAATIAAVLGFTGALVWAYTKHFSPLFAYHGLIDARPPPTAILTVAAFATLPAIWLPLSARRPSTILLWFLYLPGYVPTTVVPLFINGDLSRVLPFDIALAASMATLAVILRLPPPRITAPHLSLATFTRALVVTGILSTAYVASAFGVHSPPGLADVYGTRADFGTALGGASAAGYLIPWAGNATNPMLMTLGIARRRPGLVALGLAGQVLIYSVTGFKSVLFSIALVPLVYLAVSAGRRTFGLAVATAAPVILVLAVVGNTLAGDWSLGLARRVFATPGQISGYYFDYFSIHPIYGLSHSFLRWFVSSPYDVDPPVLIGSVYFPGGTDNANAGLWADAFANFGFAGIAAFTLVAGAVLWLVDGLGRGRDARVAAPLLAIAGLTLGDSALFTTMLTNGLGLSCALIALMPPAHHPPASGEPLTRVTSPPAQPLDSLRNPGSPPPPPRAPELRR